jgi:hypothetical protein
LGVLGFSERWWIRLAFWYSAVTTGKVTQVSEEFADSISDYLHIEATKASETLVTTNRSTRHHNLSKPVSSNSIIAFLTDISSIRVCDNFSHSRSWRHESSNIYFHRLSSAAVSLHVACMEWIVTTTTAAAATTATTTTILSGGLCGL